VLNFQLSYFYI